MGRDGTLHCHRPNILTGVHEILNGRNTDVMDANAEPEVIKRTGKNPAHSSSAV